MIPNISNFIIIITTGNKNLAHITKTSQSFLRNYNPERVHDLQSLFSHLLLVSVMRNVFTLDNSLILVTSCCKEIPKKFGDVNVTSKEIV